MRSGGMAGAKGGCGKTESRRAKRKFLSLKAFFVMHCNLRVIFKALGKTWKCFCNNSGNNNCNCNSKSSTCNNKSNSSCFKAKVSFILMCRRWRRANVCQFSSRFFPSGFQFASEFSMFKLLTDATPIVCQCACAFARVCVRHGENVCVCAVIIKLTMQMLLFPLIWAGLHYPFKIYPGLSKNSVF